MKIPLTPPRHGIALIIVLVVIFMLGILAGGFAYSMKVELRLAQNHNSESEMEWLGRSGVELASYILGQQMLIPNEQFDALNQKWAGGIGVTNEIFADINLKDNVLGNGTFSLKITDLERKFNINVANPMILQQALNLVGMDSVESSSVIDCILDWIDPDDKPRLSGAESPYYLSQKPPYFSKNGAVDDLTELLLVKGISPQMFWGPRGPGHNQATPLPVDFGPRFRNPGSAQTMQYQVGLADLFTTLSWNRQVNINTASQAVLQLFPGINGNVAEAIVHIRAGPDGVEGNEDDTPFRNPGELVNVPGMDRGLVGQSMQFFGTRSMTFEVEVDTRIGNYQRQYVSVLRRNSAQDVQILYFYWK